MPSTHTSLNFHIVFSTKDRINLINQEWRAELHIYLGGVIKNQGGVALAIGGTSDYVHVLASLDPPHRLPELIRDMKANSTSWAKREKDERKFSWQTGYGAFTVSPSNIERVKSYVLNQDRHHRKKNFKEEYVELLKAAQVEYDEQYLW